MLNISIKEKTRNTNQMPANSPNNAMARSGIAAERSRLAESTSSRLGETGSA